MLMVHGSIAAETVRKMLGDAAAGVQSIQIGH
jgi:hypothetical protein